MLLTCTIVTPPSKRKDGSCRAEIDSTCGSSESFLYMITESRSSALYGTSTKLGRSSPPPESMVHDAATTPPTPRFVLSANHGTERVSYYGEPSPKQIACIYCVYCMAPVPDYPRRAVTRRNYQHVSHWDRIGYLELLEHELRINHLQGRRRPLEARGTMGADGRIDWR